MTTHQTHPDASVRDLIAQAEQRGAERVRAETLTYAADMVETFEDVESATRCLRYLGNKAAAEHRDEHPAEPPSDVTEDEVADVLRRADDEALVRTNFGQLSADYDETARAVLAAFHVTPRADA